MPISIEIYHRMPPAARSVLASLRGYYLDWWRYDSHTERLVEEALERDTWDAGKWAEWTAERRSYILWRAAKHVPYYRNLWAERKRNGDKASKEYLENWPILEKRTLRNQSEAFVADDRTLSKMFHDHTSGTTGTALDIWLSGRSVKFWYALNEARSRRWFGLTRNDRWAILGGQMVARASQKGPPFWVWNAGMKQLYMSAYHISPSLVDYYVEALRKYQVRYILGYLSAIYNLAYEARKQGKEVVNLDVVITNAEPLFDYQREIISEVFGCPVRETYGMAEIAAAASECEGSRLHQWPDTGIIEIDPERALPDGSGDLICTGLINDDMPLVRYRVGDVGSLSSEICDCGKLLPLIQSIDGRRDDTLYARDGRLISRLDPIFKSGLQIIEAQIIQPTFDTIIVRCVPDVGFDGRTRAEITKRIRERVGDVEVEIEEVGVIPRTSNSKFRAVVCEIPMEMRPN